jgi:hypothetical protein
MRGLDSGQVLVARFRSARRQRARSRTASRIPDGWAVKHLLPAVSDAALIIQDVGLVDRHNADGRNEPLPSQATELSIRTEAEQDLIQPRRGEDPESNSCEILASMGSPSSAGEADAAAPPPDGVSAFVARVLDQLSLSAWLPAALLTASLAVLLQFRSDRSANILTATRALTSDPVRVLVLMIPLLVIATVITQAFSFEAIRTLEGYWRRRGLASIARTLMIWRHVRRKELIERRRTRAIETAFYVAEPRMLREGISFAMVSALKAQAFDLDVVDNLSTEEATEVQQIEWQKWCEAWRVAKMDHLTNEKSRYPADSYRILPTKLGNLIRATEDQLTKTEDDLQGFALRRYPGASRLVQKEHDQYRNRLEMYCILVFVSASLLILAPLILFKSGINIADIAIIAGSFAALSEASYLAAIASAAGYCQALKEMDEEDENE